MRLEKIAYRLSFAPMMKVLLPLIVGIVLAERWSLPLWRPAVGFVVSVAGAVLMRRRDAADIFLAAAMVMAGWLAVDIRPAPTLPEGERMMALRVDEILSRSDGTTVAEGRLESFLLDGGTTVRSGVTVRIVASEGMTLREGERVEALCRVRMFTDNGYGRYMWRRGVAGTVSVDSSRVVHRGQMPLEWSRRLRHVAVERISRLELDPETDAVVRAMTVGDRSSLTPEIRRLHARGGTSHLLAVSGLHVGFVFVVVNLLLFWVLPMRYGYAWRCMLVIVAIWIYAAVAGFSPSVVRAATMFSVFQTAMSVSVRSDSLNSLALTAFVMLLFDARTLYDTGFRLSFLSVAAIIEWGMPLYRYITWVEYPLSFKLPATRFERFLFEVKEFRRRMLESVLGGVIMGTVSSVVTAPLVSYLFGVVSLWGVVAGPVAVLLGGIVVGATLLWILMPLPLLEPLLGWIVRNSAEALEWLVEACARSGVMVIEHRADGAVVVAIYVAMALFTVWLWSRTKPRRSSRRRRRRRR